MELRRGLLRIQPHIATGTGNPISLTAVTAAFMRLKVAFEPTLGGSGTPSPSNIRPISGWNSVTVTQTLGQRTQNDGAIWSGTVYGGTIDLISGVLTATYEMVALKDQSWIVRTNGSNYIFSSDLAKPFLAKDISESEHLCDVYPVNYTNAWRYAQVGSLSLYRIVGQTVSDTTCYLAFTDITTTTELTAWLNEHDPHLCYRLATPKTVRLDPQTIHALAGNTTITSDAGNMDIEYWSY